MKIYINSIKFNSSLVDGPGIRTVVFLSGCDIRCKGCYNTSIWDINSGKAMEVENLANILKAESINKKITFSGGEPLLQQDALLKLLKLLKNYDIVLYTGRDKIHVPQEFYKYIKYLKYGHFQQELKTSLKAFVGSTNQKFIKCK